jgi:hypothetical protein
MDHPVGVSLVHGQRQLADQGGDLPLRQHLADPHQGRQRPALDVGHGQKADAVDLVDVEDGTQVGVAQDRGGPGLAKEPVPGVGVAGQARHLQGHRPLQPRVVGQEHRAHAARTQLAQDAIAPKILGQPRRPPGRRAAGRRGLVGGQRLGRLLQGAGPDGLGQPGVDLQVGLRRRRQTPATTLTQVGPRQLDQQRRGQRVLGSDVTGGACQGVVIPAAFERGEPCVHCPAFLLGQGPRVDGPDHSCLRTSIRGRGRRKRWWNGHTLSTPVWSSMKV